MSKRKPTILVVDDDRDIRSTLELLLSYEGYEVRLAALGREALEILEEGGIDAVLLDIKMPERDGLEILEDIREGHPDSVVIMISGHGDIQTAVEAVRKGAEDFLEKPLDGERVLVSLRNCLERGNLRLENRRLRDEIHRELRMIGESPAIRKVLATIEKVARSDARVLISGENGTGKELIARRIHLLSERSAGPFVAVNCAAIPQELLESELFGHEKGSFTGASEMRIGRFEQASGGTLFLDEIGEMQLGAQAKVLRALETQEIQRVGSDRTIGVDIRVLAATNKELQEEVDEGRFRMDLFYRLNVVPIHAPPLRERLEDLGPLCTEFLIESCRRAKDTTRKLSSKALEYLATLSWPGNVRELRNLIEGLVVLSEGEVIDVDDVREFAAAKPRSPGADLFTIETFEQFKEAAEAEYIRRKLNENSWNVKRTAESIRMQRSNLYKKLEKYNLR